MEEEIIIESNDEQSTNEEVKDNNYPVENRWFLGIG